ncbi:hypothetical protein CEXT_594211 [Caerostris extrusa]|uniref:Uncharacterized protein n=1 Tax=Caerostris extrusa TaxID=172846 RepID=A0AAV4T124_CAEEX|nr:hypothetical protein CEXT_594211 [Caerostris extrusa]
MIDPHFEEACSPRKLDLPCSYKRGTQPKSEATKIIAKCESVTQPCEVCRRRYNLVRRKRTSALRPAFLLPDSLIGGRGVGTGFYHHKEPNGKHISIFGPKEVASNFGGFFRQHWGDLESTFQNVQCT